MVVTNLLVQKTFPLPKCIYTFGQNYFLELSFLALKNSFK
ncbi:hypothetical protein HMPREF9401_2227 [Aliarcobacter butzleri JV22]|nr:hypothetical protein HMPREF9401_2227 [Aliarcobacter butzleri JV22]